MSSSEHEDDKEKTNPISHSSKLITTLLSNQIPQILNFKGKWTLINTKLTHIQSQLSDFSLSTNPLSLELLNSLSHSLDDIASLASICQRKSLSQGKLKTQNDVDSVLASLDLIIKDTDVLLRSGILVDRNDVVLGKCSSRKECVRVECRELITRLQIGTAESKNSAIEELLKVINANDKNVMIAVAQGVIPVVIRLLDSSSVEMREKSVVAIARISMVESSKHVLVAEGLLLLNHLLRVLESGSCYAKERACVALRGLSFSKENARAIGSRGGISALLEICQDGTPLSQAYAAGVLRNLAVFSEIKENFVEENAVYVLITVLNSGTALAQENAIGCLSCLVAGDDELKVLVVREGVIECLKNYWDSVPGVQSLEVALVLIRELSSCHLIGDVISSEGFIGRVVEMLSCGVLGVRVAAARAISELGFIAKAKREIGESGCVSSLIKMLDGKSVEEKEAAAKALAGLMLCNKNRRLFRKDERGILSAVQILDPSIQNLDRKYPIEILASLVHSKKCRKQMVAAGACVHLQKLLEMDIEGAKKLLDSLRHSKIWGVFSRP